MNYLSNRRQKHPEQVWNTPDHSEGLELRNEIKIENTKKWS